MMSLLVGFLAGEPQQSQEFYDRCFRLCAGTAERLIHHFHLGALVEAGDVLDLALLGIYRMPRSKALQVTTEVQLARLLDKRLRAEVLKIQERGAAVKRGGRGRAGHRQATGPAWSSEERRVPSQGRQSVDIEDFADVILDRSAAPEELAVAKDELERLSHLMPDPAWPKIVGLRLEGHPEAEIAATVAVSERTLRRMLGRAEATCDESR